MLMPLLVHVVLDTGFGCRIDDDDAADFEEEEAVFNGLDARRRDALMREAATVRLTWDAWKEDGEEDAVDADAEAGLVSWISGSDVWT